MTLTRRPCRTPLLLLLAGGWVLPAAAQAVPDASATEAAPPVAPAATEPPPAPPPETPPETKSSERDWEGAIALNTSYGPTYAGSGGSGIRLTPGFFLRYGRFSISSAGGFVSRRSDDIIRGLGVDLKRTERVRVSLSGRYDGGRDESRDPALAGMGDIKPTLRLRLGGSWQVHQDWRVGFGWSVDAFGRGGGNWGEVNIGREYRLTPATTWSWGTSLAIGGDRYMQTYYGVTPEQSANTGGRYPVYEPGFGLRDFTATIGLRTELNDEWVAIGGFGASRTLGPAAKSPLVTERNGWSVNAGLAYRF